MKKITTGIAVLLVLLLSLGAFAFQNEPNGFRGLKWGDQPTEDMEFLLEMSGGAKLYTRPSDKLYLGDVQLSLISYAFYRNEFMKVNLDFQGKDNHELLVKICRAKFGEVTTITLDALFWFSSHTSVYLSYSLMRDEGSLSLDDSAFFEEYQDASDKKPMEKAEGDW